MPKKSKRDEVWTALAERHGAEIVTGRRGRVKQVRFRADPWILVLDEHNSGGDSSSTHTRVRAAYRMRDDFRFRVYRRTMLSGIGRMFGMQDIEVGMPQLDRDYIVQSNSPGRIQALLIARDVAKPLETLRAGRFETRKLRRRGVSDPSLREMVYQKQGVERDVEALGTMIELVRAALGHLTRLGAALREPVAIEL